MSKRLTRIYTSMRCHIYFYDYFGELGPIADFSNYSFTVTFTDSPEGAKMKSANWPKFLLPRYFAKLKCLTEQHCLNWL